GRPLRVREFVLRGGRDEREVTIARLAVRGRPPTSWASARDLLADGLHRWPRGVTAKFLLLPGGFVSVPWPGAWSGRWGWDSEANDFEILMRHIEPCIAALISTRVRRVARGNANAVVLGSMPGPTPRPAPLRNWPWSTTWRTPPGM